MVLFKTGVRIGQLISVSPYDWKNPIIKVDANTEIRFNPLCDISHSD